MVIDTWNDKSKVRVTKVASSKNQKTKGCKLRRPWSVECFVDLYEREIWKWIYDVMRNDSVIVVCNDVEFMLWCTTTHVLSWLVLIIMMMMQLQCSCQIGRNDQKYQTMLGCNTHGINSCRFAVLIIDCIVGRYSPSTCFEQWLQSKVRVVGQSSIHHNQ